MNSLDVMAIVFAWGCIWILCNRTGYWLHRRWRAHDERRLQHRAEYRAELAARRARVRIRGCTCTACHDFRPVVLGRPQR